MPATTAASASSDTASAVAEIVPPRRWGSITDWDATVAAMSLPSVFLTRAWITAWWEHVGEATHEPHLVHVMDQGGQTIGLVPFSIRRTGPTGRVRRLGLLGDTLVGSEYLGAVAVPGHERAVALLGLDALARQGVAWDIADLHGLRPDDPAAVALHQALVEAGGRHDRRSEPCAAIVLPPDVDAWSAGLSGSFRRRTRQRSRRLHQDHEVRCRLAVDADDVTLGLDRLFVMHQQRWTAVGRPGVFADPRMPAFYRAVASEFLDAGWLRLWMLEVDDVVRAVQFGFAHHGVVHSLQEAYDSTWDAPGVGGLGVVLRLAAIEASIEEGLRGYDFLGGDQSFKQRWGTSEHRVDRLRVANHGSGLAWSTTFGLRDLRDGVARRTPARAKAGLRRVRPG